MILVPVVAGRNFPVLSGVIIYPHSLSGKISGSFSMPMTNQIREKHNLYILVERFRIHRV
jgi:hypothetical protein